jgi:hypothetical protein
MPRPLVKEAVRSGRVPPIDSMALLSEADLDEASHLVGQAFRALQADADVVIAGRACDTAIFAAVPALLGRKRRCFSHLLGETGLRNLP